LLYTKTISPSHCCQKKCRRNDLHSLFLGIGIAPYHRIDLVLAFVLQIIELASADVASIFGHITVDGSFADTLGNIFALSFVVRLAVTVPAVSAAENGQ
jgi:hypothetical protein